MSLSSSRSESASGRGFQPAALLVGLAVLGVIVGLVTMHVLSPHPVGAASPSSAVSASVTIAGQSEPSASEANTGHGEGCPACAVTSAGIAAACGLALLLAMVLLTPPALRWLATRVADRLPPPVTVTAAFAARSPNLTALGISRT